MAPPLPGMLDPPPGSMTIKKKIETKYKLPNLNWTSLKPGQVRGTVFSELDDEKYFKVIRFRFCFHCENIRCFLLQVHRFRSL